MGGSRAIGGDYRIRAGFRSGFGFGFWFRFGAGGSGVVVVRGVFIDGGQRMERGSDGGGAEEGGGGPGELTASMAVLRLHGWDWLSGFILFTGFVFFCGGFIIDGNWSEGRGEERGERLEEIFILTSR